ncbi:hypothetical protein VNO77_24616 [Canavalia gladiata]|uniref:Uncharacterized protein n=1 Tax=Canavalia gladiata TaxID=3824 RepID=A0AAN9QCT4_CANGL
MSVSVMFSARDLNGWSDRFSVRSRSHAVSTKASVLCCAVAYCAYRASRLSLPTFISSHSHLFNNKRRESSHLSFPCIPHLQVQHKKLSGVRTKPVVKGSQASPRFQIVLDQLVAQT